MRQRAVRVKPTRTAFVNGVQPLLQGLHRQRRVAAQVNRIVG
jgi:hypothetical protein